MSTPDDSRIDVRSLKAGRATWAVFSFALGIMAIDAGLTSLFSGHPFLAIVKIVCGVLLLLVFVAILRTIPRRPRHSKQRWF